ncbi:MAG: FAD-dependent oxidoreductase, partial [Geobacteraceae bacterium]
MPSPDYDIIIIGSGPAGLGAAFHLSETDPELSILLIDREKICSGGLLNDCKQNYTYPIGFVVENWTREEAERLLPQVEKHFQP